MNARPFQVYFGGSFDPPHRGHAEMLEALARDAWVERVLLVPTRANPIKSLSTSTAPLADSGQRWRWAVQWVAATRERLDAAAFAKVELLDREITGNGPAYTVETLAELQRARDPERRMRWALALGSDSLPHLGQWRDISRLLTLVDGVWVFGRGAELPEAAIARVPAELRDRAEWRAMAQVITDVSSSQLRESRETRSELVAPGIELG